MSVRNKKAIFLSKFLSFHMSSNEQIFDTVEVEDSRIVASSSTGNGAKNTRVRYATLALCIFYLLLSYLLFAFSIGLNLTTRYIGQFSHDQIQYIWTLNWWPYAVSHQINPLFSTSIWHPYGTDISFAPASVPGASLIALPITLILGPVASYNLLIIGGNALSAFLTFLITKYLTKSFTAGVIAGLLFGFSTYQFVQEIHLHMELTFLIPLIAFLCVLYWDEKIQRIAFIILVGSCLTLQYLFAIEIFVTLALFIGISAIIFMLVYPEHFKKFMHFFLNLSGAYALCTLLLSPFIYAALKNGIPTKPFNPAAFFSIDPLNFIIPTPATYLGAHVFSQLSSTFGSRFETSGYLGIPALAIICLYTIQYWHEKMTRFLFLTFLCFMLFSLGPTLHIAGHASFPLPEYLINKLPVISQLLPARLTVYVFFVASLLIGLWAGKNITGWRASKNGFTQFLKYILVVLALICIFPNVRGGTAYTDTHIPYFFTSGVYKQYIRRGDNVLYIPYASDGDSMLYQEYTNMYFNLAEGYVTTWTLTPKIFLQNPITTKLLYKYLTKPPLTSHDFNAFKKYLQDFKVNEVIFPQSEYAHLQPIVSRLHIIPVNIKGILVYKIPEA